MYPLTFVSGYWNIINKHDNKCESRFQYTLKINVTSSNYYHHIIGTYLHKNIVNNLIDTQNIWTDQVILTHIYKIGYGELVHLLKN